MSKLDIMMKCEQARDLVTKRQYFKAYEIIDQLAIDSVKPLADLRLMAEIYEKVNKFEDAREVYFRLYDIMPTRMVLYKLTQLSIQCGLMEEAEDFFKEYKQHDKNSIDRLILNYNMEKARGADRKKRILLLEEIRQEEPMEEWCYELAKLYHKEGMALECVRQCDEIILFFCAGVVVEKAMLLKMHYEEGIDISSEQAIERTRNLSRDLKIAARIAEANEKRREESKKHQFLLAEESDVDQLLEDIGVAKEWAEFSDEEAGEQETEWNLDAGMQTRPETDMVSELQTEQTLDPDEPEANVPYDWALEAEANMPVDWELEEGGSSQDKWNQETDENLFGGREPEADRSLQGEWNQEADKAFEGEMEPALDLELQAELESDLMLEIQLETELESEQEVNEKTEAGLEQQGVLEPEPETSAERQPVPEPEITLAGGGDGEKKSDEIDIEQTQAGDVVGEMFGNRAFVFKRRSKEEQPEYTGVSNSLKDSMEGTLDDVKNIPEEDWKHIKGNAEEILVEAWKNIRRSLGKIPDLAWERKNRGQSYQAEGLDDARQLESLDKYLDLTLAEAEYKRKVMERAYQAEEMQLDIDYEMTRDVGDQETFETPKPEAQKEEGEPETLQTSEFSEIPEIPGMAEADENFETAEIVAEEKQENRESADTEKKSLSDTLRLTAEDLGELRAHIGRIDREQAINDEIERLVGEAENAGIFPHFCLIGESQEDMKKAAKRIARELCTRQMLSTPKVARISASKLNLIRLLDKQQQLDGVCLLVEDAHELTLNSLQGIFQLVRRLRHRVVLIIADDSQHMHEFLNNTRRMKKLARYRITLD